MSLSPCPAPLFPALGPGLEPRLFWRFLRRNRRWEQPPRLWIRPRSRPAPGRVWERSTEPVPDGDPLSEGWTLPPCNLSSTTGVMGVGSQLGLGTGCPPKGWGLVWSPMGAAPTFPG